MKTLKRLTITCLFVLFASTNSIAQELSVTKTESSSININELPEYVIVTSENTKLFGGINIEIDYKKSSYADVLERLETLLQNRKKLRVRNQTDLLNALSKLGFEYINAYNANAGTISAGGGDDIEIFGGESKYRVNMVFRKKEQYRG
ncbi:hypothetical protein SAMN04489761_2286 [Tenacibaculum sp. MAR_2009_124]|uniref:hypothetical protein n=1 Tax=Tenacibaculum sp. MAR_2009_124 TaxID=1250059 RepID=UPI0008995579|nr:hypothetical protein [Tenacibaculum sp. MAR_2009_124]SEC17177.1 hypothetical protein SAMN04489761_2286 [Tenacibaculum sp. MAR_2009_124]